MAAERGRDGIIDRGNGRMSTAALAVRAGHCLRNDKPQGGNNG